MTDHTSNDPADGLRRRLGDGVLGASAVVSTAGCIYGEDDAPPPGQRPGRSTTLDTRWRYDTGGRAQFVDVLLDSGTVYAGGLDASLYALDAADGSVVWELERDGSLSDSSPVLDSGWIYIGSGGGGLYKLDASDGTIRWYLSRPSAAVATPAVSSDRAFFATNDGTIIAAVDDGSRSTGSEDWSVDVGAPVYSALGYQPDTSVDDTRLIAALDDGRVLGLRTSDGAELWSYDTGVELGHSSPVVDSGSVYLAGEDVLELDTTDGSVNWRTSYGGTIGGSVTLASRALYVGDADGKVFALDPSDGSTFWRANTGAAVGGTPAAGGGRVVVGNEDGDLVFLDESSGDELGRKPLGDRIRATPAVGSGVVYAGSITGNIVAIGNLP